VFAVRGSSRSDRAERSENLPAEPALADPSLSAVHPADAVIDEGDGGDSFHTLHLRPEPDSASWSAEGIGLVIS
jgi:hypothetical protein